MSINKPGAYIYQSNQTQEMAPRHFRFFDLPLELRDHIRDFLYEDFLVRGDKNPAKQTLIYRGSITRIRLVSRRMKHEYDHRPHPSRILTNFLPKNYLPGCALIAADFTLSLTLVITRQDPTHAVLGFADNPSNLVTVSGQLPHLLGELPRVLSQLPQLRKSTLVLRLGVRRDWSTQLELLKKKFFELMNGPHVSEIKVTKWSSWSCEEESEDIVLAFWTAAKGSVVREERVEAMRQQHRVIREKANAEKRREEAVEEQREIMRKHEDQAFEDKKKEKTAAIRRLQQELEQEPITPRQQQLAEEFRPSEPAWL